MQLLKEQTILLWLWSWDKAVGNISVLWGEIRVFWLMLDCAGKSECEIVCHFTVSQRWYPDGTNVEGCSM